MKAFIVALSVLSSLCIAQPQEEPVNVKHQGDLTIVDNVPALAWGKSGETTFCGALAAAAKSMGIETSYATLMGDSALAFRLRWWRPVDGSNAWCPSSPVGEFSPWDARAAASIGFKHHYHVHLDGKTDMSKYAADVKASIDRGVPVLCYPTTLDMGLIYGCSADGKTILVRDYFKPDEAYQMKLSDTKGLLGFLEKADAPPARRDLVIGALKAAVADWTAEPSPMNTAAGKGRYLFGDAAYAEWIANLESAGTLDAAARKKLFQPSWWTFCVLADARGAARDYLFASAPLFEGDAKAALERAAAIYAEASGLAYQSFGAKDAFLGPWSGKSIDDWTDDVRTREAAMLKQLRDLDAKAIAEIRTALRAATGG